MNFALRLKEEREQNGLSQAALAKEIGVGVSTIGMWESTNRIPSAKTLNKLIKFFNCSLDYLLGNSNERNITQEEKSAGASATRRVSLTPIEDQMLYYFREIGKNNGEQGQHAALAVLGTLANSKGGGKM